MEKELQWRLEELTLFRNQLSTFNLEKDQDIFRKGLVLILYSHFEGFIKFCFLQYLDFINSQNLIRKDVIENLIASSMKKEFNAYDNTDLKCRIFKKSLPNDPKLHKLYRQVHFLENFDNFCSNLLSIQDESIDTESNLKYLVLQKNLYRVGLPIDLFGPFENNINKLVEIRNSVSHGGFKSGISKKDYDLWEKDSIDIMEGLVKELYNNAVQKKYLKITTCLSNP